MVIKFSVLSSSRSLHVISSMSTASTSILFPMTSKSILKSTILPAHQNYKSTCPMVITIWHLQHNLIKELILFVHSLAPQPLNQTCSSLVPTWLQGTIIHTVIQARGIQLFFSFCSFHHLNNLLTQTCLDYYCNFLTTLCFQSCLRHLYFNLHDASRTMFLKYRSDYVS